MKPLVAARTVELAENRRKSIVCKQFKLQSIEFHSLVKTTLTFVPVPLKMFVYLVCLLKTVTSSTNLQCNYTARV